jgi:hypothetical protein
VDRNLIPAYKVKVIVVSVVPQDLVWVIEMVI